MDYDDLKYHLPSFMIFFALCVFYWRRSRWRNIPFIVKGDAPVAEKLMRINRWFKLIFIATCIIVTLYSLFYDIYEMVMFPIESLDRSVINNMGITILNISFIWIIVTQMNLDLIVYRLGAGRIDPDTIRKILIYSEKSVLVGFLIMLVGLFVTISSIASLTLAVTGIVVYYFFFMKGVGRNSTPNRLH